MEYTTIGELLDNGTISTVNGFSCGEHNSFGDGVPHIRPFNVTQDGDISLSQLKHIPVTVAAGKPLLEKDDIVFNNTNSKELVGKCAVWNNDDSCVFSNHMTRIRVHHERCNHDYLNFAIFYHWITGESMKLARSHVAQASIIGARFREIKLCWNQHDIQQNCILSK